MTAYYNEHDPKAAAWLRELIREGHIADGHVDERSIAEVQPADLAGFTQCHFFAGIGGWSLALRLAGWADEREVWTGSCPCQPFSDAGQKGGTDDPRHLWPQFYRLIAECRPPVIFGEQVASKDGLAWLDIVSTDLERTDYAIGAADLCAAGVGAPHMRQRLYFVAHDNRGGREARRHDTSAGHGASAAADCGTGDVAESESLQHDGSWDAGDGRRQLADGSELGDASGARTGRDAGTVPSAQAQRDSQRVEDGAGSLGAEPASADGDLGNSDSAGSQRRIERWPESSERRIVGGRWACDWIPCSDGKARPVEPLAQQMANGLSLAVGIVRSLRDDEKEALNNAASRTGLTAEIVCQMRDGVHAAAIWQSLGGRIGFPAASVLLAVMCEHAWELGRFFYFQTPGSQQVDEASVRGLRSDGQAACAPHGRGLCEQCAVELKNLVSQLSQETALLVMFNGFPLTHGAPSRVGLLRGYGNAIIPQVAQVFIEAYLG